MTTRKPEPRAALPRRQPGATISAGTGEASVRPVAYLVTVWPQGHDCPASCSGSLLVTDRGQGRWAVEQGWSHGDKIVLSRSGQWQLDVCGEYALRFTLGEALDLARAHAATFTVNDQAAADIMEAHLSRKCPG